VVYPSLSLVVNQQGATQPQGHAEETGAAADGR